MSEGRRSASRDEDEDEGRSGGGYGGGYGGRRRSMGRERDEDEGGRSYGGRWSGEGRGRGQGGWYGDREGHSEASGADGRDPTTARAAGTATAKAIRRPRAAGGKKDIVHNGATRTTNAYGRRSEGGGRYGRSFGYEDEDRRGGYGGRYESRRGGGREEDDERYERSGRGRGGHGGWSGDPEGHAEAARRGWEHRR